MGYIGAGPTRFNTADSLNINGDGATVTGIKDEDNMASDSAVKLATQQSIKAYVDSQIGANNELSEVLANGNTTGGNNIAFADNDKAIFGAGSDLQIYHNGNDSVVRDAGTGDLLLAGSTNVKITTSGFGETMAEFATNGAATLYYDNAAKLATTSSGIDVTGTVTADGLTVDSSTGITVNGPSSSDGKLNLVAYAGTQNAEARILAARGATSGTDSRLKFYTNNGTSLVERIDINDNGDIAFMSDNGTTQGLYWDASAQALGLGTTSPSNALTIESSGSNFATMRLEAPSNTTPAAFQIRAHDGLFDIRDANNSAIRMTIDSSGNVGIGTASPTADLHISYGSGSGLLVEDTTNSPSVKSVVTSGNTESYFGATSNHPLVFLQNNTERMRIDSSGNVAIGDSVAEAKLHVKSSGTAGLNISQGVKIEGLGVGANGDAACLSFAAGDAQVKGAVTFTRNSSYGRGYMSFLVNGDASYTNPSTSDERMRITSGGNVGIGTSPLAKFHVDNTNSAFYMGYGGNEDIYLQTTNGNVLFTDKGATTERMRVDSSGNLLVGKTSDTYNTAGSVIRASGMIRATVSGDAAAQFNRLTSDGTLLNFSRSGSTVGSVSVTTTGTTYNTTSDIRLKTDIAPIADATDKLMSMNAVSHKWKAEPDADAVVGFIAQEMAEIVPEAVSKGEGEDDMWSMDYGRITPVLVAALQDAHKKIEQLEQRIAEMEAN